MLIYHLIYTSTLKIQFNIITAGKETSVSHNLTLIIVWMHYQNSLQPRQYLTLWNVWRQRCAENSPLQFGVSLHHNFMWPKPLHNVVVFSFSWIIVQWFWCWWKWIIHKGFFVLKIQITPIHGKNSVNAYIWSSSWSKIKKKYLCTNNYLYW